MPLRNLMSIKPFRIAVVGGGGHVGLPLSLKLAEAGFATTAIDTDAEKVRLIGAGSMPFLEEGGQELLTRVLGHGFQITSSFPAVSNSDVVIITIGTPIDEHLNPDMRPIFRCVEQIRPFLSSGHIVVLRSTLFPGTSEKVLRFLQASGLEVGVSCCPERIVQGRSLQELGKIPQLISASDERTLLLVREIFLAITTTVVELSLTEAEVAKLFSNAWRYVKFAVANQFYTIAREKGLDFQKIRDAMVKRYERARDFPTAGLSAGPCLFKDTMQLAAFSRQQFALGHAAMLINETLPEFLVEEAKAHGSLAGKQVGILGMAYKAENDDPRESLAYKLKRLLEHEEAIVLCTDPFVKDPQLVPLKRVLESVELLIIACPHTQYRKVDLSRQVVIDCWGLMPLRGAEKRSKSWINTPS